MSEKVSDGENPTADPMTIQESTSLVNRAVYQGRNSAIRPLQRYVANRNPGLIPRFQPTGGFVETFANDAGIEESRVALERMSSVQNTLILNRLANNDIERVPALATLKDISRNNGNNIATIATSLSECCETLRSKIDSLREFLTRRLISIENLLKNSFSRININLVRILRYLRKSKKNLIDFYLNEKQQVTDFYIRARKSILNSIRGIIQSELQQVKDDIISLETTTSRKLDNLSNSLNEISEKLTTVCESIASINGNITGVSEKVTGVEAIATKISGDLGLLAVGFAEFDIDYKTKLKPLVIGIEATAVGIETTIASKLIYSRLALKNELNSTANKLESSRKRLVEKTSKEIKKIVNTIPTKSAEETSLVIVGEAYQRWDSITSYFPCICFIFNEETENNNRRRSQIRLRINKASSEFTETDISELQSKVLLNTNLNYTYGGIRGNYISGDKRLKTTVYGNNREEIERILKETFSIINEPFEKDYLTITTSGNKRTSLTKRRNSLNNYELNNIDYNSAFKVTLKKVYLLINNLKYPIKLYP